MQKRAQAAMIVIAAGLLVASTACAPVAAPVASPSPTPTPTPTATGTPAPTEDAAPVPAVDPTHTPEDERSDLCAAGSMVAIWAHYDDDLIFGHSRVTEALEADKCVTIAYLSGGDAGRGVDYSRGREQGIRNAYDTLRGYDGDWTESQDVLETGVTVEEWQPANDPRLTLLSFRLVDGNLDGSGFAATGFESMAKLAAGVIPTIRDVDGPVALTQDQITASLAEIIDDAHPDELLTGMPREVEDLSAGDHADHAAAASFAHAGWRSLEFNPNEVSFAIGYQTSGYPANVGGPELERKVAVFSAYAIQDPVTASCRDLNSCLNMRLFGDWLQREYQKGATEIGLDRTEMTGDDQE